MTAALAEVQKSLAGLTGLGDQLEALTTRVDAVAEQAKKTEQAVNGVVFNEADGDPAARGRAKKSEGQAPPLLDTAYGRAA